MRIFAVFGGFSAAPLAAVSLNHSEGILSGFFGDFGDSLGILEKMDHLKVLTRKLKDFW